MIDDILRSLWGPAYTAHCLEVADEPVRAVIWIITNLAVAFAYFGIPREIGIWARAMSLSLSGVVARMFQAFIVMCGISHIAMIAVMPTANWLLIVFIFAPLACVSVGVYVALRKYRKHITGLLQIARKLLSAAQTSAAAR